MRQHKLKHNLTGTFKRNDTSKAKCLEIVTANPGISSTDIKMEYRRFLRKLELDGVIKYQNAGWYVKG